MGARSPRRLRTRGSVVGIEHDERTAPAHQWDGLARALHRADPHRHACHCVVGARVAAALSRSTPTAWERWHPSSRRSETTRTAAIRGIVRALCGVSPMPASFGDRADRYRLNKGGDRDGTARCTRSRSTVYSAANAPAPTSTNGPLTAWPTSTSSAASSATSPARCTRSSPKTSPTSPSDQPPDPEALPVGGKRAHRRAVGPIGQPTVPLWV